MNTMRGFEMAKQAKILSQAQEKMVLAYLRNETKLSQKNTVAFLLSTRAMMRAKEIALLEWNHLLGLNPPKGQNAT